MEKTGERAPAIEKLAKIIHGIKVAMLTTQNLDGSLHSRPMLSQYVDFDGDLWFFTSQKSWKVHELAHNRQVSVVYAEPKDNRYVSISGRAEIIHDREKMEELWNPFLRAWFEDGLEDPDVVLLKVNVERAEYWDSPGSAVIHIVGFAKTLATGKRHDTGQHEIVDLHRKVS
jgi:general stress protein 26